LIERIGKRSCGRGQDTHLISIKHLSAPWFMQV
jgi:hypothetical protein